MIRFVDMFRDRFGVEAICRTIRATACGFLTARGYRASKARAPSARTLHDQRLVPGTVRTTASTGCGRCTS